jgi:S1-C subfamily serine protease
LVLWRNYVAALVDHRQRDSGEDLHITIINAATANPTARGGAHTLVTFADGHTARFDVVAMDRTSDIAVVQARGTSGLTPITFGSSDHLRVGQKVVAVGSPQRSSLAGHRPGSAAVAYIRGGFSALRSAPTS